MPCYWQAERANQMAHIYIFTSVKLIFRKINEDVGMAKVPKTFEYRWWYICRQFKDDAECLTIVTTCRENVGINTLFLAIISEFSAYIPLFKGFWHCHHPYTLIDFHCFVCYTCFTGFFYDYSYSSYLLYACLCILILTIW